MTVVSDVGIETVVCSVDVVACVVVDCISGSFVLAAIVFVVVEGEGFVVLVVVVGEGIVVLVVVVGEDIVVLLLVVVGEGIVVLVVIGGDVDLVVVAGVVVVIGSVGKGDVDLVVDGARVGNGVSSPCTKHCTCS